MRRCGWQPSSVLLPVGCGWPKHVSREKSVFYVYIGLLAVGNVMSCQVKSSH